MRHTPCPMPPHSSAKTQLSAVKASQRAVEILATLTLSVLIHIKLLPRLCTLAIKTFSYLRTQTASLSLRTKEYPAETEQNLFLFFISVCFPEPGLLLAVQPEIVSKPLPERDGIEREDLRQGAMRGM